MDVVLDEARGGRVGSVIKLEGVVFGIRLAVEEVVIERTPPRRKVWETVGEPRLLVIGAYQMGFELTPISDAKSWLRVFIDYALPRESLSLWLGRVFGRYYARWCTRRMVTDTVRTFASRPVERSVAAKRDAEPTAVGSR